MASSSDGGVKALVDEDASSIVAKLVGERLAPAAGNMIVESVKKDRSIIPIPANLILPVRLSSRHDKRICRGRGLHLHGRAGMVRIHCSPAEFRAISAAF